MNPEIEIRPMIGEDLAEIQALAESLPAAPHWPASAWLTAIDPASTPRRISLVATTPHTGPIYGFAVASLLPPQAELESIAVAAHTQRQGLGKLLFHALTAQLGAANIAELDLEVRASNHPALAFYRILGFTPSAVRRGYYADPIEDAVLMRFSIPGRP